MIRFLVFLLFFLQISPALAQNKSLDLSRLKEKLRHSNEEIRLQAVDMINRIHAEEVVPLLREATKDSSPDVVVQAIAALSNRASSYEQEMFEKVLSDFIQARNHLDKEVRAKVAEGLGALGAVKEGEVPPIIWESLLGLIDDPNAIVRKEAMQELHLVDSEKSLLPLIDSIDDRSLTVRSFIAKTLGKFRDERVQIPLYRLLKDPDASVRATAAVSLGEQNNSKAVPKLLVALEDPELSVRKQAIIALGNLKDKRAIGPLLSLLPVHDARNLQDSEIRREILDSLAEVGGSIDIQTLASFPRAKDKNPGGNPDFPQVSERIPDSKGVQEDINMRNTLLKFGPPLLPALRIVLHRIDPLDNDRLRTFVVWVLEEIEGEEVVDILLNELSLSRYERHKTYVIRALGTKDDPRVPAAILPFIQSKSPSIRQAVLEALAQNTVPQEALQPLIQVLDDPVPSNRKKAIELLGRIESSLLGEEGILALLSVIKRVEEPRISENIEEEVFLAISTLRGLQDSRALEAMLEVLKLNVPAFRHAASTFLASSSYPTLKKSLFDIAFDKKHPGRAQALRALYLLLRNEPDREMIQNIAVLVEDIDFEVSYAAARVVSLLPGRKMAKVLLKFFADSDVRKTRLMARLLPSVSKEDAILPLLQGLDSIDGATQVASAWGLGMLKDTRAVEPLIQALRLGISNEDLALHRPGLLAINAAAALGFLGDKRALPALKACLDTEFRYLRANCALAFARLGGSTQTLQLLEESEEDKDIYPVVLQALAIQSKTTPLAKQILEQIVSKNPESATSQFVKQLLNSSNTSFIPSLEQEGFVKFSQPLSRKRVEEVYLVLAPDGTIKVGFLDHFSDMIEVDLPKERVRVSYEPNSVL